MAFTAGLKIVPGYPLQLADKFVIVFDRTGPTSYTQFVSSTGLGGDILKATGSGLNKGGFDYMDGDFLDTTGQVSVFPIVTLGGYGNAAPQVTLVYYSLVTATLGGVSQTANTQIAAATNLSTFSFRLRAFMV